MCGSRILVQISMVTGGGHILIVTTTTSPCFSETVFEMLIIET